MLDVTIEDLSAPSGNTASSSAPSRLTAAKTAPSLPETSTISDLGKVTLSAPTAKSTLPKPASTKIIETTKPVPAFSDPLTGEKIAPTQPPKKKAASKPIAATLDLATSEQVLRDEAERFQALGDLSLDKDNFVPNLTTILDSLSQDDTDFQQVVASLDPIFADIDDESIQQLGARFRTLADDALKARAKLERRVDILLNSFPEGNNWFRLLAAWDVLTRDAYAPLKKQKNWQQKLDLFALELLGEPAQQEIIADCASGIDLQDSLENAVDEIEKHGVTLTEADKKQLIKYLTPAMAQALANPPAPATKTKQTINSKTPNAPIATAVATKAESMSTAKANTRPKTPSTGTESTQGDVDSRWMVLDARIDALQKSLLDLGPVSDTRLDSFSHDLTLTAQVIDTLTSDLATTSKRLSQLEQATASGIRQLGETSVASFSKIATQLEGKLEKEKQAALTRQQTLKDQLAKYNLDWREQLTKNNQDLRLKITALDEAIGTFKKLQTAKDQDQNKKLTGLRDQLATLAKASGKQVETNNSNLSRTRQDIEERLHQLSKQLTDIKSDQIKVDQVQTTALGQLATQAQAVATQLTALNSRLEKAETTAATTASDFMALRARYDEQISALTTRLNADLETNRTRIDKINAQVADLQAYASRLETENEELRITNAGLKQENWQARRQLGTLDEASLVSTFAPAASEKRVTYISAPEPSSVPEIVPAPMMTPSPTTATVSETTNTESSFAMPTIPVAPISELSTPTGTSEPTPPTANSVPEYAPTSESAPTVSNLVKLGILTRRLPAGSRLLTGRPLDFISLNRGLETALTGINSFSNWLHTQRTGAPVDMPAIQETPISGPTQIPVVPDYPEAHNVTPEVPLAPAVETLPMADHVAAASVTNSNGIPTPPLDFPQPQTVEQIPSMIPTDLSRPPVDSKTPIPVPPALDEDVMVLNPNLPIGDTYSAPRPASRDQDDTVVLPFMS